MISHSGETCFIHVVWMDAGLPSGLYVANDVRLEDGFLILSRDKALVACINCSVIRAFYPSKLE